uniref:Uncharacterized protein n=1 Tax=Anguilla anguilla TaxID=7936 RepID=A0A0E9XLL0_ANGAN
MRFFPFASWYDLLMSWRWALLLWVKISIRVFSVVPMPSMAFRIAAASAPALKPALSLIVPLTLDVVVSEDGESSKRSSSSHTVAILTVW